MELKQRIMATMLELVAVPGISGTVTENLAAQKIYELLCDIPYFKTNPQNLQQIKLDGDIFNRNIVSALFCSSRKSDKTVIITGHYDVVGIEGFGHLKDLAFSPYEYTKRVEELGLDDEALCDLRSDKWMFGRGVADMKHGIALAIELLRELSARDDFSGNILFLAVPGEETNSEGMLGSLGHLTHLQDTGYKFVGLLLAECCSNSDPDDKSKRIYLGAAGKIMPLFFFAGKETHVDDPFEGLNAVSLMAEVNRLFDLKAEWCDNFNGSMCNPPVCLKQTDLKDIYCVTTPLYATSYYNLPTFNMPAAELIIKLKKMCSEAFENVLEDLKENRTAYEKAANKKLRELIIKPVVITYDELHQEVKKLYGDEFDRLLSLKIEEWKEQKLDIQTIAINLVKETYEKFPHKAPMIIIGFAPPYYPHRYPDMNHENMKRFFSTVDGMIDYAKDKYDELIVKDDFYGVSDFSYTGLQDSRGIDEIANNLLGLGHSYIFPVECLKQLDIPAIVLGGWAKDFHKNTERLNIPFSFDIVPDLYEYMIYNILK